MSRASGYVPETVRNLRTIRTLGKETYMETRYDGALGESYRAIEGTNFYDALYSPVILTVNAAVVGAVMLLSASGDPAVLTLFGMTAGTAVTVMNYISQIFSPLESLGMEIQTIQSAVAGVRRINDFLAQPEQETVAPETENPAAPMVELRDVDFGYEAGQNVLHHLNMEIREGELATLSGRTGAGKSTVFKLVLGLYAPPAGTVRIQGVDPRSLTGPQRRALYGYVEQRFHPVPGTVRDQITLYDDTITEGQVRRAAELAGLAEAIGALPQGYDTPCTPDIFSQGQWQLLSIARAVAADPKLLLAGRDHSQSGRGDGAGGAAGLEEGYGGPDGALHFSPGRGGHGTAHSHWGGVIARNRASAGLGLVVCHAAMISSTSPSPMRGTNTRLSAL